MKTNLLFSFFFIIFSSQIYAQEILYAAAKAGLNMREQADASSPIITKVPYGGKITFIGSSSKPSFKSEGMETLWIHVSYGNQKGYVASVYTLPIAPPTATGNLEQYANQLGKAIATWSSPPMKEDYDGDGRNDIKKTLYNNGIIYRSAAYYESGESTLYFDNLDLTQAFILARLLSDVPSLLNTNDPFPSKQIESSETNPKSIQLLKYNTTYSPQTIRIETCEDACYWMVISCEAGVTSITFGSGV